MFAVDTNILVHAANSASPKHEEAVRLIENWRNGSEPWCITWGVAYEFLRVVTHSSVLARPFRLEQGLTFLREMLGAPFVAILTETSEHFETVARLAEPLPNLSGNLVYDLHIAALMVEHGVREIWTEDADFHRFRGLKAVNPL